MFKLVPLLPTRAMIDAGVKAFQHARYQETDPTADWKAFYVACVKAAPSAEECQHQWGIDGMHNNEYCKKCFVSK